MAPDSPLAAILVYRPSSVIKASQVNWRRQSPAGTMASLGGSLATCVPVQMNGIVMSNLGVVRAQTEIESLCCSALHMASILMRLTRKLFTFLPAPIVYGKVKPLLRWANNSTFIQVSWLTLSDFTLKSWWSIHAFIMNMMLVMFTYSTRTVRVNQTWIGSLAFRFL